MKSVAAAMIVAAVAACLVVPVVAAPKPSQVPVSWQLDIDLKHPRAVELTMPGRTEPERFWYIRYTVTNRSGRDCIFVPEFVLYTDTGQILRAGYGVPTAAFKAIKQIHNEPLLKDTTSMTGKLLQGEDNAKDGLAVWRDFDPAAGEFDIFIGGLSGETAEVQLPRPIQVVELDTSGKTATVTKEKLVLAKTLHLKYGVPGEAAGRTHIKPEPAKKQWVMR
jgi:hypothetical protein